VYSQKLVFRYAMFFRTSANLLVRSCVHAIGPKIVYMFSMIMTMLTANGIEQTVTR